MCSREFMLPFSGKVKGQALFFFFCLVNLSLPYPPHKQRGHRMLIEKAWMAHHTIITTYAAPPREHDWQYVMLHLCEATSCTHSSVFHGIHCLSHFISNKYRPNWNAHITANQNWGEKKKREKEKASDHINSVDIEIDSRCSLADSPI